MEECSYFVCCPNSLTPYYLKTAHVWGFNAAGTIKLIRSPCKVPDFNQIWIWSTDFMRVPDIKFHGNPFSGRRADACGQMDGRDEGNRLLFFRKYANSPKMFRMFKYGYSFARKEASPLKE